jgi:hypothetical protein
MSVTAPQDVTLPRTAISFISEAIFKPSAVHYNFYKVITVKVLEHSGNCMYQPGLTFKICVFCLHSIFIYSLWTAQ